MNKQGGNRFGVGVAPSFDIECQLVTKNWLDARFSNYQDGHLLSHEPIYGFNKGPTEGGHARRATRLLDLLSVIVPLAPESYLDVGAAEGYLPALVRELTSAHVLSLDLSTNACQHAVNVFGCPGVAANASLLPFPDNSFDVVSLTEVVEHLVDPVSAFLEAQRVARHYVVVSTEEWANEEAHRDHRMSNRVYRPHMERNIYAASDIGTLFGDASVVTMPQRFPTLQAEEVFAEWSAADFIPFFKNSRNFESGGVIIVASTTDKKIEDPERLGAADLAEVVSRMAAGHASHKSMPPGGLSESDWNWARDLLLPPPEHAVHIEEDVACGSLVRVDKFKALSAIYLSESTPNLKYVASRHPGLSSQRLEKLLELDRRFDWPPDLKAAALAQNPLLEHSARKDLDLLRNGHLKATTSDPQLLSPYLCVRLDWNPILHIRYQREANVDDYFQLFFTTSLDSVYKEENSFSVSILESHGSEIVLDLDLTKELPLAGTHLTGVRVDPSIKPGTKLDFLEFSLELGAR